MAEVTAEARLIVGALELMETREMKETWLTTYLRARDHRAPQVRRVFGKTDPTSLVSGSPSSG